MITIAEYLNEHPFHDYVFMYNGSVYQTYKSLLANKYVKSVKRDSYGCRYTITAVDMIYYNETVTPMHLILPVNKTITEAKNDALNVLKQFDGITIEDDVIVVHYPNKIYKYKLHTKKLMKNLYGEVQFLPYIRRI